jgi:hypothetical protein
MFVYIKTPPDVYWRMCRENPDLLTFYDTRTPIEQTMFLEHRMRAFQGRST